ncbi:MAG: S-layer homology domain-containing protein [Acidimicrobiales bacterium]|nr:S-layer homology domain-containing protein [Acidimicrobiales bacterium]
MRAGWKTSTTLVLAVALAAGAVAGPAGAQGAPDASAPPEAAVAESDPPAPDGPPLELTAPEGWLPRPLPTPQVPSVAFVGDSIGRDAGYYVRRQVQRTHPVAYYHSVAAGYIGYHLPRLRPVVEAPGGPDILLVELGTGDAFWDHSPAKFERDVRRFLDTVLNLAPDGTPLAPPDVTCVRWFDQKPTANIAYPYVNEHRTAFNRILGRVLAEHRYASRNVALVPYAAWYWLSGDRGFFLADRLHHTEAGRRELGLLAGQAAEGCDPSFTSGPFWDVPDRSRSAEAVAWAGTNGIADPYRNGTYRAQLGSFGVPLDRSQFAQMLWRLAGSPTDRPRSTWSDVPTGLRRPVGWVQAEGIMRGYPDGTFRGGDLVTREALAVYLWRAMQRPTEGVVPRSWPDVAPAYAAAVDWAVTNGILAPYGNGSFGSGVPVMRALAARTLHALALYIASLLAEATAPTTTTTTTPVPGAVGPAPGAAPPTTVPPSTPAPPTTAVPPTTLPPATTVPSSTPPAPPPVG